VRPAASRRVAFAGTPEFAAAALRAILEAGYAVPLVLTQPDRPAGRGMKLTPSPVKQLALAHGIAVDQPERLRSEEQRAALAACAPDVLVVAAYGLILPRAVLELPRLGCVNIHASLLPRWRGAAPIHRAIEAGDAQTGITIMQMDEGLDTGATAMPERVPIGADMTAGELHDALARLGADLMARALSALERGSLQFTPQPADGVTYAAKIDKAETRIDWSRPWRAVHDHIRGLSPFPGAWCEIASEGSRARLKVLRTTRGEGAGAAGTVLDVRLTIACGEGAVRLLEVQRAGREAMRAEDFLRGTPLAPGTRLP
jgi:methionyl-tRNA formyltransferase